MIVWLIGLSGVGKSAIGRELYNRKKSKNPATVFIDGDEIREVFKNDKHSGDYSVEGRRKNAERISALCVWLDRQGIDVVCCILSLFEDNRRWNRDNFDEYFEVFIEAPFEDLVERNPKNLYRQAQEGLIKNVVGVDIIFESPKNPDITINNPRPYCDVGMISQQIEQAIARKYI